MEIGKKIFVTILFTCFSFILYGQSDCNLYIDELEKEDTLKVSIVVSIGRSESTEQILIFKNKFEKFHALINTDSVKNISVELTNSNINTIKRLELGIRKQKIENNVPFNIHSLAEYQITYKNGSVSYSSKEQFYSLYKELIISVSE